MLRYLLLLSIFIPLGISQNTAVYPTTLPTHDTFTVLANSARDDLNTTITSGATSIILDDASAFFSPGANEAGIIKIDDEFIKYCTITSNTLTVCTSGRGFDGSSATAHNAGATVRGIYASHHHNQLAAELVAITDSLGPVNTVANLPGSPTDGDLARVTNGNSTTDCITGGGTDIVLCMYDSGAVAWGAIASAGAPAPSDATYITQTTNATLSAEQALSALITGILKSTTTTGVLSIAVDGDFPSTLSRDSEAVSAGDVSGSLSTGYTVVTADAGIVIDSNGTFGVGEGVAFGDGDTEIYESADDILQFLIAGDEFLQLGGSQTALFQNTTATTGDTKLIVKEGAANALNLLELQANNGDLGWIFSAPETLKAGRTTTHFIRPDMGGSSGITGIMFMPGGGTNPISGSAVVVDIKPNSFFPTSGTATYTGLSISGIINQTGGANGITRGLHVNPTLTAAADFRGIEVALGGILVDSGVAYGTGTGLQFGDKDMEIYESADDLLKFDPGVDSTTAFQFLDADGGLPILNIDSINERVCIGCADPTATFEIASIFSSMKQTRWSNSAGSGAGIVIQRSRGATVGADTVVQSGDHIGSLNWRGYDGANFITGAMIQGFIDNTPGINDMPGRLVFSTTADGANSATERMRIDSAGDIGIGTASPEERLHVFSTADATGEDILILRNGMNNADEYIGIKFRIGDGLDYGAIRTYLGGVGNSLMSFLTTTDGGITLDRQMTIDDSGRVGIGIVVPIFGLHILKSDANGWAALIASSHGTNNGAVLLGSRAADTGSIQGRTSGGAAGDLILNPDGGSVDINNGLKLTGIGATFDSGGAFGTGSGIIFGDGNTEIYESADNILQFRVFGTSNGLQLDASGDLTAIGTGTITATNISGVGISDLNASTSADLLGVLSDETGTLLAVFSDAPTFTTSIITPVVISADADPADAGVIRLGNTEIIAWEPATPGTDVTLTVDSSDAIEFSGSGIFRLERNAGDTTFLITEVSGTRLKSLGFGRDMHLITFQAGGTENSNALVVDTTGSVAVGINNPIGTFDVKNDLVTTGNTEVIFHEGDSLINDLLQLVTDGDVEFMSFSSARGLDTTTGTITFADSANVASATTTALGLGNLFHITGTTTITTLNTCDAANNGRLVSLIFDGVLTFTDGNNLILAGDFVTTANDAIQIICDGSNWYETSRSIN